MPGVIMENGGHTNHDRQPNGITAAANRVPEKGGSRPEPQQNITPTSPNAPFLNGLPMTQTGESSVPSAATALLAQLGKLPPEIQHVTLGYISTSKLIERAAEQSYGQLTQKINEQAQRTIKSAVNGNVLHSAEQESDPENVEKKRIWLEFFQAKHAEWTKILAATNWSRQAEDVGKLIDLKAHLVNQKYQYDLSLMLLINSKKKLHTAGLPSPDFKTAVEVLSTGKAPWMPDLGYKEPPSLKPREMLRTLENINTLLHMRLVIDEHDKIPPAFKEYTIKSGRVTFKVPGEFEVDLTIASEDSTTQFWFIGFRFLFSPALAEMPASVGNGLEHRINAILEKDGLAGCYRFLHEMTLTVKIGEFRKQAWELARGTWISGLEVEPLDRTLSIQYWKGTPRPKSFILLGVHSGKPKHKRPLHKAPVSRLSIRWFRDGKEMKDIVIPLDVINISAEKLLRTVIAMHTQYLMDSICSNLQTWPLFSTGEATLSLSQPSVGTDDKDDTRSSLTIQLTNEQLVCLKIEQTSGRFYLSPVSIAFEMELQQFNKFAKAPIKDVPRMIELLRYKATLQRLMNYTQSTGWVVFSPHTPGVELDDLRQVTKDNAPRWYWFRRREWKDEWSLVVSMSVSGEKWWLLETTPTRTRNNQKDEIKITSKIRIPIKALSPAISYNFFLTLVTFTAGLISHYTNLRSLHSYRSNYILRNSKPLSPIKLPTILVRLSQILPSQNKALRSKKPWAKDTIQLTFQGLEVSNDANLPQEDTTPVPSIIAPNYPTCMVVTQARMVVNVSNSLSSLKENVDRDIAFSAATGVFAFRLRSRVGFPVIPVLIEKVNRVERLVEFVEVFARHSETLVCDSMSLDKIIFSYKSPQAEAKATFKATIDFGSVNTGMTIRFEANNPHLRILDHLDRILNSQGLDGIATLLPLTLPLLQVFDAIETEWTNFQERGEVVILVRSIDHMIVRYDLVSPKSDTDSIPATRKVKFDFKLQNRCGEAWWMLSRGDARDKDGDEIDAALQSIWDSSGAGWEGMRKSAVTQSGGLEDLIKQIDEVVRTVELSKPSAPQLEQPQPVAQQPPQQNKPQQPPPQPQSQRPMPPQQRPQPPQQARPNMKAQAHMQQYQQRQQPTPNNSQSQTHGHSQGSQNRMSQQRTDIIELD
ncbi:mediator complex subunit MED14-domain-containing protein [Bisporella sp. PMI_857]|nr:mediator complex subunit MED14-domain-containing protein [Bisporella sp. PMI_857]